MSEGRTRLVNGVRVYPGPVLSLALDELEGAIDNAIAIAEEHNLHETAQALSQMRHRLTDIP